MCGSRLALKRNLPVIRFICYIGIAYQLPGAFMGERANHLTSHLKAMGLLDSARIMYAMHLLQTIYFYDLSPFTALGISAYLSPISLHGSSSGSSGISRSFRPHRSSSFSLSTSCSLFLSHPGHSSSLHLLEKVHNLLPLPRPSCLSFSLCSLLCSRM